MVETPRATVGDLEVVRLGPDLGLWPWRRADYAVYQLGGDGSRVEVVNGQFRDPESALWTARGFLGRHW